MKNEKTIKATANHAARTFTLRLTSAEGYKAKYRTTPMSKEEFTSCLHNTNNDWLQFLKSSDYYKV